VTLNSGVEVAPRHGARPSLAWLLCTQAFVCAILVGLFAVGEGYAQTPTLIVQEIEVEGNRRVERDAILQRLTLVPGSPIEARALGNNIRSVYELGFFDDIQVLAEEVPGGFRLIFVVTEKPSVARVRFIGNDAFDDEELREEVDISRGSILDHSRIRAGRRRIEEIYREKGYYLVEVDAEVVTDSRGDVIVEYTIREAARVRVERVTFVGNDAIDTRTLQRVMMTRPGSLLSFLTKAGNFQREEFAGDLQRLRLVYYDSGYLDVNVGDPLVELTRDLTGIHITIPIEEGDPYYVTEVSVTGDFLIPQEELMEMLRMEPAQRFRSSTARDDIERLTNLYRDAGYANANVNLLTRPGSTEHTIGVQYDIQQGELCYIGRISVIGNSLTRDRVIRRELVIEEGAQYSGVAIRRSQAFVRRLGFFEDVQIREQPSRSNPRVIDLQIQVTERPTRSLQVGAGFSSIDSFIATMQISENNLFGRGQSLTLNAQLSAVRTLFLLSFVEPYLFDTRLQLGVDFFKRQELFTEFERDSQGASVSLGYRPFRNHSFWRDLTVSLGYQVEYVRAIPGGRLGRTDFGLISRFDGGLTSSITSGVALDRRNDRLFPTDGYFQAVNVELAEDFIGSENEFFRLRAFSRWYSRPRFIDCGVEDSALSSIGRRSFGNSMCRWFSNWVGKVNFELGYVGSTNRLKDVPIFERFFVGGPTSVRGFDRLSLSPTESAGDRISPDSVLRDVLVGGFKQLILNIELEYPILAPLGITGVFFFDAGNAFDRDVPYTLRLDLFGGDVESSLRTAVGFGFRWRSPIGPLRFEWGYPLMRQEGERRSVFEFSIQNAF